MQEDRYKLAHPVKGGYSFWCITDREKDMTVVEIFGELPHAETNAQSLCDELNLAGR